jgi:hypothetical protein
MSGEVYVCASVCLSTRPFTYPRAPWIALSNHRHIVGSDIRRSSIQMIWSVGFRGRQGGGDRDRDARRTSTFAGIASQASDFSIEDRLMFGQGFDRVHQSDIRPLKSLDLALELEKNEATAIPSQSAAELHFLVCFPRILSEGMCVCVCVCVCVREVGDRAYRGDL